MSNFGMGVMINMLAGTRGEKHFKDVVGKTISDLYIEDSALIIKFDDGTGVKIEDDGQSCCETRYMTCDDELGYFVGATLVDAMIKDVNPVENEEEENSYEDHDVQFLEVVTSKGSFTIANHNRHNGYYGGFWIAVKPA